MKTMMKKLAAYLLALLLVLQIVPVMADEVVSNIQGSISEGEFRDKLAVTTDTSVLEVGMTVKLETTEGYDKLTWTSDNPDIASVENGVVTAKSAGQVKITAEQDGYSDSVTLKVIGTADVAGDSSESEKMIIIITGKKDKVQYNGEVQTNTYTATSKNPDFNPDNLKLLDETAIASSTDCGVYKDTMSEASFEYEGADAEFVVTNGWLQIKPAQVTVTVNAAEKKAGEEDPELTAVVTGLFGEDTIDYTGERYPGEEVGKHIIDVYGDEKQGNYKIQYVPGIMTITESEPVEEEPESEPIEEETVEPLTVWISSLHPADEPVEYGMGITLVAEVTGAAEGEYTIRWQYSTDMANWTDIPGANSLTYTFTADGDTVTYSWRAVADRIE